uniref:Uncharacterized protein n=1 Tax=Oryza glumipatula TaxID=40148 RepID=A0A0E0ASA0_9ORYZ
MRSDDKGAVEYERYHVSLHRTALPPKSPLPRSARLVIDAAGSVAPAWHRCLIRSARRQRIATAILNVQSRADQALIPLYTRTVVMETSPSKQRTGIKEDPMRPGEEARVAPVGEVEWRG